MYIYVWSVRTRCVGQVPIVRWAAYEVAYNNECWWKKLSASLSNPICLVCFFESRWDLFGKKYRPLKLQKEFPVNSIMAGMSTEWRMLEPCVGLWCCAWISVLFEWRAGTIINIANIPPPRVRYYFITSQFRLRLHFTAIGMMCFEILLFMEWLWLLLPYF